MPLSFPKTIKTLFVFCSLIFLLVLLWLPNSAFALGGTQPEISQPAPNFSLMTNGGKREVTLTDYRGKWVVLYFYPQDFTPGCTLEAQRFQRDLSQYKAIDAEIIGVSADDVNSHEEFCESEGLKFPLLADTTGAVSKSYGSWLGTRSLRHTYLIDPNGILRDRFIGVQPAIHSQEVLARLKELQG